MSIEQTLIIIKPNAIIKNVIGDIINTFEKSGLSLVAIKMIQMSLNEAKFFYKEHYKKIFFMELINFMSSGPILIQVFEGENAIVNSRNIIGHTNPNHAFKNTIRAKYSDDITKNAIHGSDTKLSAQREIIYFFSKINIFSRKVYNL